MWYDPSDLTTMLQDDTSAAPAVIGQPVGTILDKSQGLKLGSELITNGDFAADSDWVKGTGWSISGGVGVANGVTSQNLRQNGVALEENKVYSVTFTIVSISQGSVLGRFGGTTTVDSVAFNAAGTYTFFLKANSTNSSFMLRGQGGFTGTVDNVLVKEVLGNHATQTTSTKRPVLARHPEGGIRNLLSYTQEFDDAFWNKANATVTANFTTAPDGTQTADKMQFTTTTYASVFVTQSVISGSSYTLSVFAKAGNISTLSLEMRGSSSAPDTVFNLSSGTITSGTGTIEDYGDGWYRCTLTQAAIDNSELFIIGANSTAGNIYLWGAQLEEATEASNYQKVVTDIDVTESGVGEVYYLKFDGVSDGMKINNLTSPNTPLTAWFGYSAVGSNPSGGKYLLDVQTGRIVFAGSTVTAGHIGYFDGQWSEFAADSDAIKVLTYDLVQNNAKIRVDGTQEYSDTTYVELGLGGQIGLFQNYPFTGSHLAGNLYSCILRAAESTDKEIASTESYVAKKTGLLAQVDGLATLSLDFGGNTYTARNSNGGIL